MDHSTGMDLTLPSKNIYDTYKDEIWKELGPLDPDWFESLTAQTFTNEGHFYDQDDLCANQEGNFKTPLDKSTVESQLFSTPKAFRLIRVVSPETGDDHSFTGEQAKADESPCPVGVSAEQDVVFVRKLFPSLSNPSKVEVVSPKNNGIPSVAQGVVSPEAGLDPESHNSPQSSLNLSDSGWKEKLPDAIEDGDIRKTEASVLDGAEHVLSIFFRNSSSALRKVKSERIKRKQIIPTREHGCCSTDISSTNDKQRTADQESGRLPSSPPVKTGDVGITQWSPLNLSEIPPSTVEASCYDSTPATQVGNIILTEQLRSHSGQLVRPLLKLTDSGFTKKKRTFIYTIGTSKPQVHGEGKRTQKIDSSPVIPDYGNTFLMYL
ncbi:Divergent paired-related homeobox [Dissostichus eleginoides]|uniref:Divergent paired-related homeobox n=1 Tax=Dissostichus eleginoides TaxID=100907 RepID=A0AAD9FF84_DISEL|nr:Divergent paired-related homeobox [Dissostichus eleginoides]